MTSADCWPVTVVIVTVVPAVDRMAVPTQIESAYTEPPAWKLVHVTPVVATAEGVPALLPSIRNSVLPILGLAIVTMSDVPEACELCAVWTGAAESIRPTLKQSRL